MAHKATAGVYEIRNTVNNKVYIGSSINVQRRLTAHKNHLKKRYHASAHLQAAWDKYGADAFVFKQLIVCAEKDILFYEQLIIDGFKANQREFGYNKRIVVESGAGMKLSEEHKAKIAASVPRGKDHQYYGVGLCAKAYQVAADLKRGKPMSDEQKAKISKALRGRKQHAGFGAKISAAKKGVKYTDEQKKNMTGHWKGKKFSCEHKEKIGKLNYEKANRVRELFKSGTSQKEIAAMYSLDKKTINNVINMKTWV